MPYSGAGPKWKLCHSVLTPWQTRTHCCGHIVADTNVSPFARARNICCGHKKCFWFLFRNILCPQLLFPSLCSPRNIMCPQQCVLVYQGLKLNWVLSITLSPSHQVGLPVQGNQTIPAQKNQRNKNQNLHPTIITTFNVWYTTSFPFPRTEIFLNEILSFYWLNRELTLKCKLKCYVRPMKDPLGVSPSKGNQGTTRGKEKFFWPRWESNPWPPD